jgi:hypothetical protein
MSKAFFPQDANNRIHIFVLVQKVVYQRVGSLQFLMGGLLGGLLRRWFRGRWDGSRHEELQME